MRTAPDHPTTAWSRERLLLALVAGAATCLLVLAGVVLAVLQTTDPDPTHPGGRPNPTDAPLPPTAPRADTRDRIAAATLPPVAQDAAFAGAPALVAPPTIAVPEPAVLRGPAGVPTGFPHTPEGAVAQLAALKVTVLAAMDLQVARQVHQAWAMADAVPFEQWVLARNTANFLGSSGQPGTAKTLTTLVQVTPAAALVKGTDGPDWVLACVLSDVRVTVQREARMGYGYCERLQWHEDRWQIAPGSPPAPAPHTWPGSQAASDVGWKTWTHAEERP